tara:strand:- start:367 stop:582 length:216 start_codon:yes stop_codon:yes gene_type:complete
MNRNLFKQYKLKIAYKVVQVLITWCVKNKDSYNHMICVAFNGIINDYQDGLDKAWFNESIYKDLKKGEKYE